MTAKIGIDYIPTMTAERQKEWKKASWTFIKADIDMTETRLKTNCNEAF